MPYAGRTIANWLDFLDQVDAWVDPETDRVYAVLDNLSTHRAHDVVLWASPIRTGSSSSSPPMPPT